MKSRLFVFAFCAAWLLVAAAFIYLGRLEIRQEHRFTAEGVTVSGTLTNKSIEERQERDRETKKMITYKTFYAHYQFASKEGRQYDSKDSVSEESWKALQPPAAIQIQYLPGDPRINRVARESSIIGGLLMCGFGFLAACVGCGGIGYDLWRRRSLT